MGFVFHTVRPFVTYPNPARPTRFLDQRESFGRVPDLRAPGLWTKTAEHGGDAENEQHRNTRPAFISSNWFYRSFPWGIGSTFTFMEWIMLRNTE